MPANRAPAISIGMPVFNGERHLAAALASLRAQTLGDYELLISDNASDDRTAEILAVFAQADPRIRVFTQASNVGAAANYNFVLAQARAPLFKWAAHDDVLAPRYLEACHARLQVETGAVLCHSRTLSIDVNGRVIGRYTLDRAADAPSPQQRLRGLIGTAHWCTLVFGLIRREVLLATPAHGDWVGADRNLLAELALHGPLLQVDEDLFMRRDHAGASISRLRDETERQRWYGAGRGSAAKRPTWRRLQEYARSIARAPLDASARRACRLELLRWVALGAHHEGGRVWPRLLRESWPRKD